MRLIDSDVFKTEYENLITWVSHRAEKARLREFIKDIQNQPTVKAIPIEFIEEQIAKTTDINSDELDILYAGNLGYLLKLWEKENETN